MVEGSKGDAGIGHAGFGLTDQTQALSQADKRKKRFALNRDLLHLRMPTKLRQTANYVILDLRTRIDAANDEALVRKLLPGDLLSGSEWVSIATCDLHTFVPQRLDFAA